MNTLALRLGGPMQAWGSRSRFTRRETELAPTRSGVIGLLAAARGMPRTADLSAFDQLRFAVRVDRAGRLERDFQTARSLDGSRVMPLSDRFYLCDAVFVAAVEGEPKFIAELDRAVRRPYFPLYLGRRSCPPDRKVALGVHEAPLMETMAAIPWQASFCHRGERPPDELVVLRDADLTDHEAETWRDVPVSFDPRHRRYDWREVVRETVMLPDSPATPNDSHRPPRPPAPEDHNPMFALENDDVSE